MPPVDYAQMNANRVRAEQDVYLQHMQNVRSQVPEWGQPWLDDPELGPMLMSMQQGGPNSPKFAEVQFAVMMRAGVFGSGGGGGRGGGGGGGGGGGVSKAQQAEQFKAEIGNMVGQMGLTGDFSNLAQQAADNNWSVEILRDMLADNITWETSKHTGMVQNIVDKSKAAGGDYFMNISDEQALGYAKRVARNELDENSIISDIRQQAKDRFYWLAPQIEQGATMKQIFEPHRQSISKLLEVAPETVDFTNDLRWSNVIKLTQMDGTARAMDIGETERFVRGLDDWKKTNNAKSQSAGAVTALAHTFGAM